MPRFPLFSSRAKRVSSSVYSKLACKLGAYEGEPCAFHVGDTYLTPVGHEPGTSVNRYTNTQGEPALLQAVVSNRRSNGDLVTKEEVLITAGATGALSVAVAAVVDPKDEVIICAPFWPLINGMVKLSGGKGVFVALDVDDVSRSVQRLTEAITPRTVAIYWNTPSNPLGRVFSLELLTALTQFAKEHGLWVFADEVYERLVFQGEHHATRMLAKERTISAYSFSKAYGMAGYRVGYLTGPEAFIQKAHAISTQTIYHPGVADQRMALSALSAEGEQWLAHARESYWRTAQEVAEILAVSPPQGSTFFFIDLRGRYDGTVSEFLEEAVHLGVLVAPGSTFGPYPHHIRLCFTSAPHDVTVAGVKRLAGLFTR